jgi:hypothetical protein
MLLVHIRKVLAEQWISTLNMFAWWFQSAAAAPDQCWQFQRAVSYIKASMLGC